MRYNQLPLTARPREEIMQEHRKNWPLQVELRTWAKSQPRFLTGILVTSLSLFSVVICAANQQALLGLYAVPTLMIGTAMITLELRKRSSA